LIDCLCGQKELDDNPSFFILCGPVVLGAIGIRSFVGCFVMRQALEVRDGYRMRQDGNVMEFRKPLALQRMQLAAFWFAVLVTIGATTAAHFLRDPILPYIEGVVGTSISLIFLYLSGPDDIQLDGKQRSYKRTVGWPWKPTTCFGSFSGVKGICISPRNTVLLLLEKPDFVKSTNAIVLSYSGGVQPARALAEGLNRAYGFSIVPYPKNV